MRPGFDGDPEPAPGNDEKRVDEFSGAQGPIPTLPPSVHVAFLPRPPPEQRTSTLHDCCGEAIG
jgi:hypothetical protein